MVQVQKSRSHHVFMRDGLLSNSQQYPQNDQVLQIILHCKQSVEENIQATSARYLALISAQYAHACMQSEVSTRLKKAACSKPEEL
jgi:hypothetical protein